ncbi:MAG: polyprenyl synthetase family protein [Pseudobdellovibrionaceae bacterium]
MKALNVDFLLQNLQQNWSPLVNDDLQKFILDPANSVLNKKGKGFRSRIVEAGYLWATQINTAVADQPFAKPYFTEICNMVEILQSASLIIDDIQDGAQVRRGVRPFHLDHGIPLAINTGTWLYFLPQMILNQIDISPIQYKKLSQLINETLVLAHLGQGLDLSLKASDMHESEYATKVLSTMRLKTGALLALAFTAPAIICNLDENNILLIKEFATDLGAFLQMCDDLGNLNPSAQEKRFEDLHNGRLTFIHWAVHQWATDAEKKQFQQALLQLPQTTALVDWVQNIQFLNTAKQYQWNFIQNSVHKLSSRFSKEVPNDTIEFLQNICIDIFKSYE